MINQQGYTFAHEHLHIDLSAEKNNIDCLLDQYELIRDELIELKSKGVANIVEVTNRYMGRNPTFLLNLMRDTGINIIASTGYYQQQFYPPFVNNLSIEELAQSMIDEINEGIDGTELKATLIGEIGTSEGFITETEKNVFQASVIAHQHTRCPISTHTSLGTMGIEQVKLLKTYSMELDKVVIGHCDLKDQLTNILTMIDMGVYVQFDTIGKNSYFPDKKRISMLKEIAQRGLLNRVMLSMDITRRSHLKANGGLGFSYLLDSFVPMLKGDGFSEQEISMLLKENPNKFFNKKGEA